MYRGTTKGRHVDDIHQATYRGDAQHDFNNSPTNDVTVRKTATVV